MQKVHSQRRFDGDRKCRLPRASNIVDSCGIGVGCFAVAFSSELLSRPPPPRLVDAREPETGAAVAAGRTD